MAYMIIPARVRRSILKPHKHPAAIWDLEGYDNTLLKYTVRVLLDHIQKNWVVASVFGSMFESEFHNMWITIERIVGILMRRYGNLDLLLLEQTDQLFIQQTRPQIFIQHQQPLGLQQQVVVQQAPQPQQQAQQLLLIQQQLQQQASPIGFQQQPGFQVIGAQGTSPAQIQASPTKDRDAEVKALWEADKKREKEANLKRTFEEDKKREQEAGFKHMIEKEKKGKEEQDRARRFEEYKKKREEEEDFKRKYEGQDQGKEQTSEPTKQTTPYNNNDSDDSSDEGNEKFDPYEALGLRDRDHASEDVIKDTYGRLAQIVHPDKQIGKSEEQKKRAAKRMYEINRARDILLDAERRKAFDEVGAIYDFEVDNWRKKKGGPEGSGGGAKNKYIPS